MITLVGTNHSDVSRDPALLDSVLDFVDYDHVFTEGMSVEAYQSVGIDELVEELEESLGRKLEAHGENPVNRGIEPYYFTNNPLIGGDDLTFLDDVHAKEQMLFTIRDSLMPDNNQGRRGIPKEELDLYIRTGEAGREEVIDYLRYLEDTGMKDFGYASISYPSRFNWFKKRLSTDFIEDTEGLEPMEQIKNVNDRYQEAFLEAFDEYGIDRFDLQRLEAEDRLSIQEMRDRNWYNQITEYLEQNPGDQVLVVAGLNHAVDGEDTLRRRLEENYPVTQVSVKPLDYDGFQGI